MSMLEFALRGLGWFAFAVVVLLIMWLCSFGRRARSIIRMSGNNVVTKN